MVRTSKKGGVFAALIIGPIFTVIGFCIAFFIGKPILNNAKKSADWPNVIGVVERSKVVSKRSDNGTTYGAEVLYKYEVDGKSMKSNTVSFGGGFSSSNVSYAQGIVNKYPKGDEVKVYYDPETPANAVLEPGVTWKSYLLYGIGLLFLAVGLLVTAGPLFYIIMGVFIVGGVAASSMAGLGNQPAQRPSPRQPFDSPSPEPRNSSSNDDGIEIT